jgi:tRNA1(Val) A37 N6-methylase TrmN6
VLAPPDDLAPGCFDRVMMNPPYQAAGRHTAAPDAAKAAAHGESDASLADWLKAAARFLKPRGGLTLIHRADRLDEILALLRLRFGGIIVCPLWPRPGKPARRVLLAATLGSRAPMMLTPGFALHQADGRFTAAAEAVLRDGAALPLL